MLIYSIAVFDHEQTWIDPPTRKSLLWCDWYAFIVPFAPPVQTGE